MKAAKRIGLFLLLFGVPLFFLYPLAKGEPNSKALPYFGLENPIKDFTFYELDSTVVDKESTKGKTMVVSTLIPSCPSYCPILQSQLKFLVYDKLNESPAYKDLIFLSHLIDTNGIIPDLNAFLQEQKDHNFDKWKIVTGKENPIYDLDLPKGNMIEMQCDSSISCIGGKPYYQMILLIDKSRRVRGIYQGNQTLLLKGLREDIRTLFIEYKDQEKKANN